MVRVELSGQIVSLRKREALAHRTESRILHYYQLVEASHDLQPSEQGSRTDGKVDGTGQQTRHHHMDWAWHRKSHRLSESEPRLPTVHVHQSTIYSTFGGIKIDDVSKRMDRK